jgi:hypothetical protein
MRLFFLALGVGGQRVARPLPGVVPGVKLAAEGAERGLPAGPRGQRLPQRRQRPVGGGEAELPGREAQEQPEQVAVLLVERCRAAWARGVGQGEGAAALGEAVGPIVDGLPAHAQRLGDFDGRAAAVEFQQGERAAVDADVDGVTQLLLKPAALPRREPVALHGGALLTPDHHANRVSKDFW